MLNVVFLSSGVLRACLNALGKVPVRRDVLMMCVSAGKSVGEIAWRRCEGIGSRGHVVGWLERRSLDTSASVRGQKAKRGVLSVDVVVDHSRQLFFFFYWTQKNKWTVDLHCIENNYIDVNGYQQLFGLQHFVLYFLLCSTEERNSYNFGTTWR